MDLQELEQVVKGHISTYSSLAYSIASQTAYYVNATLGGNRVPEYVDPFEKPKDNVKNDVNKFAMFATAWNEQNRNRLQEGQ